jgi:hypothetical protein
MEVLLKVRGLPYQGKYKDFVKRSKFHQKIIKKLPRGRSLTQKINKIAKM